MCGVFSAVGIDQDTNRLQKLKLLSKLSESRGKEASGLMFKKLTDKEKTFYSNSQISKLINQNEKEIKKILNYSQFYIGHTRIVTHGSESIDKNLQPVKYNETYLVHNGICVNYKEIWKNLGLGGDVSLDSMSIAAFIDLNFGNNVFQLLSDEASGEVSIIGYSKNHNKLFAYTNTGSIYFSIVNNKIKYLASENHTLNQVSNVGTIEKLDANNALIFTPEGLIEERLIIKNEKNIKHQFSTPRQKTNIKDLKYVPIIKRCTNCILPETVPFINFDKKGVCNYCLNYRKVLLKKISKFEDKLDKMRRSDHGHDSVVSFSGGRDSSYGLHLLKTKYNMNPLAVSYDWGLLSDLGRLNQSIMTSKLGIEHIWFSADIKKEKKCEYEFSSMVKKA